MTAIDATTWIGLAVAVVAIVVVLLLRRRQANAAPATAAPPAKQAAAKPSKPAAGAARAAQPKASKHEASGGRMRGRSKHEHPLWRSSLSEHTDAVTSVAFTPASARVHLVATSSLDRTVRIWSGQTLLSTDRRNQRINMDDGGHCTALAFNADGSVLLGASSKLSLLQFAVQEKHSKDDKGTVLLKSVPLRHAPGASLVGFACTTDGQYAISCADQKVVNITSRTGELVASINTNQMRNYSLALSPDNRFIGVGTFSSDLRLWAIDRTKDGAISGTSKAALLCRDGHKASVHAIAINHNSTRAVTASKDGSWKLWNIDVKYHLSEDARCLKTVVVDGKPVLSHVAITPDQTTVVVSDGRALLFYSLPDGTALEQVPDAHHGASITSLSWSPDSALLASSGEDGVVHLWQTPRR